MYEYGGTRTSSIDKEISSCDPSRKFLVNVGHSVYLLKFFVILLKMFLK